MSVVYLVKDPDSGHHKVGMTGNMRERLLLLMRVERVRLVFIWAVATNSPLRTENYLKQRWQKWHVRGEWYDLPSGEVDYFRGISAVNWKDVPPINPDWALRDVRPQECGRPRLWNIVPGQLIHRA
jgi:hypothetical protein